MTTQADQQLSGILSFLDDAPETYDFAQLFGNNHPVELEIGSGKGLFLVREGSLRPEVNFFGVEWALKYARNAAERISKHGLTNVHLVSADARMLLPRFPDGVFQAVHVYFPDPWWKRRHRKRRLFNEEFLAHVVRMLRPQGVLRIATDVEEYFGVMQKLLAKQEKLTPLPPPEPNTPAHNLDYLTHFERKYRLQGRPIFRAEYLRP